MCVKAVVLIGVGELYVSLPYILVDDADDATSSPKCIKIHVYSTLLIC